MQEVDLHGWVGSENADVDTAPLFRHCLIVYETIGFGIDCDADIVLKISNVREVNHERNLIVIQKFASPQETGMFYATDEQS